MSVEFRQRSAGEFVQMLKRRKWQIILPTLAVVLAVGWSVRSLPNFYESTTFLTLKPPTISEKIVQSLSDEDLSQRLQSISQSVLSRASLEPMVAKYNLFERERASGVPMELIIDRMRANIKVEPEKTGNEKVSGFRITYLDRSPEAAKQVTAELTIKYVNAQVIESTRTAETTREFIDNQMEQAKGDLDALEKERLKIMMQNVDTLPESAQGLIAQLEGLRQREQTISKDKETLINERGRVNESISALNSQMRLIENFGEKETQEAISQAARIEDTPFYGQLIQKRAELSGRLESLKKQYRDKHPDIIQARTDIVKINEELDRLAVNTNKRVEQANQSSSRKAEMQKQNLEIERRKYESQIGQIEQQMQMKAEETRQNSAKIAALEAKINTIPNVKVSLEAINNQYQSAKSNYDDLLKKYNNAQGQVQRETNAQGETIRVVDEANLPQSPANASKKPLFVLAGAGIGLAFGLFLAAIFEVPRLFKIQNIEDTKHYTGLPVWASVPSLFTHQEIYRRKYIHWMNVLAGMVIAFASIPILIKGLQMSRIFERMI